MIFILENFIKLTPTKLICYPGTFEFISMYEKSTLFSGFYRTDTISSKGMY